MQSWTSIRFTGEPDALKGASPVRGEAVGNLLTVDSARRETPRRSARRWLPTLLGRGGWPMFVVQAEGGSRRLISGVFNSKAATDAYLGLIPAGQRAKQSVIELPGLC